MGKGQPGAEPVDSEERLSPVPLGVCVPLLINRNKLDNAAQVKMAVLEGGSLMSEGYCDRVSLMLWSLSDTHRRVKDQGSISAIVLVTIWKRLHVAKAFARP